MRLLYSLFIATLPAAGVAFMAAKPQQFAGLKTSPSRTQVYGYLDDLKDVEPKKDTVTLFDDYVKKVEAAFGRAQTRMDKMQKKAKTKEKQSQAAVEAIEERMKNQEDDLTNKLEYALGDAANVKVEAERERQSVIDRHRAREEILEGEMQYILQELGAEREMMRANKASIEANLARKEELDAELTELQERFDNQAQTWSSRYDAGLEARRIEVAESQKKIDEMEQKSKLAAQHAEQRVADLQEQLTIKEDKKEESIRAIQEQMKAQERELKDMVSQMSDEIADYKAEAKQEKKAIIEEYEMREQALRGEIQCLHSELEKEKEQIRLNQEMTGRVVAERVALDNELGELKRQHEQKRKDWTVKYQAEQEARRYEVSKAQLELEEQQKLAVSEAMELHDRVSNLNEQLSVKEKQKYGALLALKNQMQAQTTEFKEKVNEMGVEVTNTKIEAEREKMAVIDEYKTREARIQVEMVALNKLLEEEKGKFGVNRELTHRMLAQRVELDAELGTLKRDHEQRHTQWSAKFQQDQEARRVEVAQAKFSLEQQQDQALAESEALQRRVSSLQSQVEAKERQKLAAVLAIKDEMKAQEKDLKGKVNEMGLEVINLKVEAERTKMAVIAEYKAREHQLHNQIESLYQLLDTEKDAMTVNKGMTNRILAQRIEIDVELGELKRRYETDSQEWGLKYTTEQQTRRMEVTRSQQKMKELHQNAEQAVKEAEKRQVDLKSQLVNKERQKLSAVLAIKDQMMVREQELNDKVNEIGMEMTNLKIEANRDKMAVVKEHKAREQQLKNEIEGFNQILKAEKEAMMINKELTDRILAQRVEIDAELGHLKRLYETDSKTWDSKYVAEYNARRIDVTHAQEQMQELQKNADLAMAEAEARQMKLAEQMASKEKQQQAAVLAIKDDMNAQEKELKNMVKDISREVTTVKTEANKEKMAIIAEYKAREQQLQNEMEGLQQLLTAEKDAMKLNHDTMQNILAQRVEIESQLGSMKTSYERESKEWNAKVAAEQETRRVEVTRAQQQMETLQWSAEHAGIEAEKRRESLMRQLSEKEKEKQDVIRSTKEEMQALETEVREMLHEMGTEFSNLQMTSNEEKTAVGETHKMREAQLQKEINSLVESLESEKVTSETNKEMMNRVLETRADLDAELDELKRRYEQDSSDWGAKYAEEQAARRSEVARAQQQMDELQENSAKAAEEAEQRQKNLMEQLTLKENQKEAAVLEVQNEMKAREKELENKVAEFGSEVTNVKLEAEREKTAVAEEYQSREQKLKQETNALHALLETERESIKVNQELTNRILTQRIEIDAELGNLKKVYDQDNKQWGDKYKAEQMAREREVLRVRQQLQAQENRAGIAGEEAKQRLGVLVSQLAAKEQEKQQSVRTIKDTMRNQEQQFKSKANDLGSEATNARLDAHKERMAIASEFEAREQLLREEMEDLRNQLAAEKDGIRVKESTTAQEQANAALEKRELLENDEIEKARLRANVKLFLQQGRVEDALKYLGE